MTGHESMASRWQGLMVAGVLAAMVLGGMMLGGCAYRRGVAVPLKEPETGWPARSAIDVQNFHGSVTVVVDPTLDRIVPSASAGARQNLLNGVQWRPAEAVSVVMDVKEQNGGQVLVVRSGAVWPDPEDVWVDLTIRMPSCNGVIIWNRGGPVELVGVSGAVHVENGPLDPIPGRGAGRSDGRIELRTDAAMTEPVALVTTRGTVVYQVGPNSTGMFELVSGDRPTQFYCREVRPDQTTVKGNNLTVQLNGGHNPVMLRSDEGLVRAKVVEDAATFTNHLR